MTELFVTNFNPNFTGVSATAAGVLRAQAAMMDAALVGHPLPGCPAPMTKRAAVRATKQPKNRPFAIWHVRRNPEMRTAIWARDVLKKPMKVVFTSSAQRLHSAYPRWLIARMDAVIATTEAAADYVPNVRAVVPHGVDVDRFAPAPDRAVAWKALEFGGARGIATVGRVRPEKGTDVFVDAMIAALPDLPDVVALIVGNTAREHQAFERRLKEKIAAADLTDRILFTGEVASEKLPDLMRAISLLVALPRYEGYGMTPLEAMSAATPFVGSDAGYYHAFSSQGRTGVVVAQEDAAAAASKVRAILSDPGRLENMGQAARDVAVSHYSVAQEAAADIAVYEDLWAGR
ncbi:MAG: glycosyltransferase family 4 protein [Pseudomonadota bacterium]